MFRTILSFLVAALVVLPNVASATTKLVAVLPLSASGNKVAAEDRELLEELVRTIAGDALVPHGYTVLTGETTLAVLSENGIDAAKACEASCSLQAARELKAELFISGSVTKSEGNYVAFIKLFDVGGKQLSSVMLEGAKIRDLRQQFDSKAESFFGKVVGGGKISVTQTTETKTTETKTTDKKEEKTSSLKEKANQVVEKVVGKKEERPVIDGVMVHFDAPTTTTSWSLMNDDDVKLCDLPCNRMVGKDSGYRLQPADNSRAVKIQDDLKVDLGRAYRAKAKLPKGGLLRGGWLAASIPAAAIFTLGGVGMLMADSVASADDFGTDSSTSSGSSYTTTGVVCLGIGAAAIIWTVFIFKNMKSGGVDLTPMDASAQLDFQSLKLAQRSMPVVRPIR